MEDFIKENIEKLGFKLIKYEESTWDKGVFYGVAHDIKANGMTQLQWCSGGHSCTYFGDKLEKNISIGVKKDGGTRHAFNGYVFTLEDFERVLKLTW